MSSRRKRQYLVGGLLGVILLSNIMFFGIVFYNAFSEYVRLGAQKVENARQKTMLEKQVATLTETQSVLDSYPADRTEFLRRHLVSRQDGFARIIPILDEISQNTGVRKTRVEYSQPSPIPQYGLHKVSIKLPVQGEYEAVRQFIRQLQNASTVFIITAIDVHGGSTSDDVETSEVSLTLAMETYFYDERS